MRLLVAFALAGCYDPPTACGIACTDRCPGALTCQAGVCVGPHGECAPPPYAFARIAVGGRHACGLDRVGALACWGDNTRGQLGERAVLLEAFLPRPVPGTWDAIAAGAEHTCALQGGAAWCWGDNAHGQAGGTGALVETPQPVAGLPAVTQIAAGGTASCAIGDGALWCWGDGSAPHMLGAATAVSVGFDHACALAGDGAVCWGHNDRGQAGPASRGATIATPMPIALPGPVRTVVAGDRASCAILASGALWCWGALAPDAEAPAAIGDASDWTAIAPGRATVCGIHGGTAVCWGDAADIGALGNGLWSGSLDAAHAAVLGPADELGVSIAAASGELHAFGCLRDRDETRCWGDDASGELGIGAAALRRDPVEVAPPSGHAWAHVAAGREHVCATTEDRALYCWGSDAAGAIRAGAPRGATAPCTLDAPCDQARPLAAPVAQADELALGDGFVCATSATTQCWGDPRFVAGGPAVVAVAGAPWTQLSGGDRVVCGHGGGGVACWGDLPSGHQPQPTPLPGADLVDTVAAGDGFLCAHRSDGARACVGANAAGQLGDGTQVDRTAPEVLDPGGFRALAARTDHACGVATAGGIACWGANAAGKAGQPTGDVVLQPAAVAGLAGCTAVALGDAHACALCGGAIACWGDNARGALGRGDVDRSGGAVPAPLALPGPFTELALTARGGCALAADHRLACWGDGRHGELGNGGQARNVPTPLGARP